MRCWDAKDFIPLHLTSFFQDSQRKSLLFSHILWQLENVEAEELKDFVGKTHQCPSSKARGPWFSQYHREIPLYWRTLEKLTQPWIAIHGLEPLWWLDKMVLMIGSVTRQCVLTSCVHSPAIYPLPKQNSDMTVGSWDRIRQPRSKV